MEINWLELIQQYVSISYLLTFILLSYALKDLTAAILSGVFKTIKYPKQTGVLIIGILVGVIFFYVFGEDRIKLAVSYAVGTSMYDIIINWIVGKLKEALTKTNET